MAENRGFWGIDIGQAGLKAIRLRFEEGTDQVVADAFDYVPHPKILSQPDVTYYKSVAFVKSTDYWHDQTGKYSIQFNYELLKRGYSEEDIEKICSGNLLRLWKEVEETAKQLQFVED